MAATITDNANNTDLDGGAFISASVSGSLTTGQWLVSVVAASNDGTNGASCFSNWTSRSYFTQTVQVHITYDPGAAGAGATLLLTTHETIVDEAAASIIANFSPNFAQAALQVYKVAPGTGEAISFVAADTTGLTGNATTYDANTVSVTNGDIIFGAASIETDDPITGDTDTTNGSWSTVITRLADGGADASTMSSVSQYKTVTATGNQSWAATSSTARDSARSYIVIRSENAGFTATLAKTLDAATLSANATVDLGATLSKALAALASSANATVDIDATLNKTLGSVTTSANAEVTSPGDSALNKTLGALTSTANATVDIDASLSKSLGAAASSANATVDISATASKTLNDLASTGAATVDVAATLSKTLDAAAIAASGTVAVDATLSRTLGDAASSTSATVDVAASLAKTLADALLSGAATVGGSGIEATLAKTLDALSANGAASVDIQATLDKSLAAVTLSASGSVDVDASVAKMLGALASAASATIDISATLARTLDDVTLSAAIGEASDGDCFANITLGACIASGQVGLRRVGTAARDLGGGGFLRRNTGDNGATRFNMPTGGGRA